MNYIFVGIPASGKSTARKYLAESLGFQGFECSDYVKDTCRELGLKPGELFRQFGRDFAVRQILDDITAEPFVISGCRKPEEIRTMKDHYECKVIAVYASEKRCFQRYLTRKRDDDIKTFEDFWKKKVLVNYSVGLEQVIRRHTDMMVDNDHDDEELYFRVLRDIVTGSYI